ncbi:hypothetical protein C8A00DRAFT_14848 [Chaetomidium leptoderma]|uniref:Uncharacterized protein n=1 Tax=Chaetomidium leptoderma TaxID=669021 RepID=A0AAN6VPE6_9PEZI|nr:hypothetical protein C8A00DRAFT_14848 [Chaetomidium leptoderma]
MQGDPACDWTDFLEPQLRRFPRVYTKAKLRKALGNGIEGCVARVKFDDDDSRFALKIFFNSVPDENDWWPLEREARNVAILEKVQAGLRQSSPTPVHVPTKRTTRLDCLRCLYAFSADGRRSRDFDGLPAGEKVAISSSFTRVRKCFGWTRVRGADFVAMNNVMKLDHYAEEEGEGSASHIERGREYFAIVYEYLPEAKLELNAVQRQLDFFYHTGFHLCQDTHERNWQGPGVLLDFGDYNSPVDRWFQAGGAYHPCLSAEVVIDMAKVQARAAEERKREHELREAGVEPTEEEEREEERALAKEHASADTARFVEWGYTASRWFSKEEILENKLEEDPLANIHIPAVEPRALGKVWNRYRKQKKEYLSQVANESDLGAPESLDSN